MNQMTRGTKVEVAMSLDAEVVREARALTSDIGATVERLLAAYVASEQAKRIDEQRGIEAVIAATNAFVAEHGLPGEDYAPV